MRIDFTVTVEQQNKNMFDIFQEYDNDPCCFYAKDRTRDVSVMGLDHDLYEPPPNDVGTDDFDYWESRFRQEPFTKKTKFREQREKKKGNRFARPVTKSWEFLDQREPREYKSDDDE